MKKLIALAAIVVAVPAYSQTVQQRITTLRNTESAAIAAYDAYLAARLALKEQGAQISTIYFGTQLPICESMFERPCTGEELFGVRKVEGAQPARPVLHERAAPAKQ